MNELTEISSEFNEIIKIISDAKENALRKVNEELVKMYWAIGKHLSLKSKDSEYGDKYIDEIANLLQTRHPELKGGNRRGLYRMKQFYETYCDDEIVSPLVTQLSWTNNLIIMSGAKSREEREFYIKLAIKERYSKRELERQIDSSYYERAMLSKSQLLPVKVKNLSVNPFLDSYVIEFLDLPEKFSENNFRKEHENPSVGLILCANKDSEIVEYAMSRTLSPLMVAQYQLKLPNKEILQKKLQELVQLPGIEEKFTDTDAEDN
jgi:predicted nuclease of restriction endonuclease-like (RecB) superfamily